MSGVGNTAYESLWYRKVGTPITQESGVGNPAYQNAWNERG